MRFWKRSSGSSDFYKEGFAGLEEFIQQQPFSGGKPSCWLLHSPHSGEAGIDRSEVAARLLQNGIETRPTFYPLPVMPAFSRFAKGLTFPNAESISSPRPELSFRRDSHG